MLGSMAVVTLVEELILAAYATLEVVMLAVHVLLGARVDFELVGSKDHR
jgi:hypothetical protein